MFEFTGTPEDMAEAVRRHRAGVVAAVSGPTATAGEVQIGADPAQTAEPSFEWPDRMWIKEM